MSDMIDAAPPALHPCCPNCGSKNIVRDACARWDVDTQRWALADVHQCDFCDQCSAEGEQIARWVATDAAANRPLSPAPGARVRIRERTRIGGDRFKGREGFIVRTHFAGFYVRLDMTARERTQKTELVETGYLEVLWLAGPPEPPGARPEPSPPPKASDETSSHEHRTDGTS